MQFIKNGPDIPEHLLQAHEEGRVVFFCGAGISSAAGLPGFEGLVTKLYEELGHSPNFDQQAAIKVNQFDIAINLLEADIQVGREGVRRALAKVLSTDDVEAGKATATHEALLTLAKNREGETRLITTNFDRLFEKVKEAEVPSFKAPLLPVLKKSTWNGLVYLHGLLPVEPAESSSQSELEQLVVSSGDFGLAYLAERWAARFVSELFRNFTVCFVGYSISDPVMRYMLDALAADRLRGENSLEMFAFGCYSKGKKKQCENEWKAKNITPILYRAHNKHQYLHKTLCAWAEIYRDGVGGKERIVVEYAGLHPSQSTAQDDFVGRMLWALSDPSGFPARQLAKFNPAPSFDWLKCLDDNRYGHADLSRFGVSLQAAADDKLAYSLIKRPTLYPRAPQMALVDRGPRRSNWDKVMSQLACWLVRYLNDPELLYWVIDNGGRLHEDMAFSIERHICKFDRLEAEGNTTELNRICENSPQANPRPAMRILWGLVLNGRLKSNVSIVSLLFWREQFESDGLTASVRFALREMLKPYIQLSKAPALPPEDKDPNDIKHIVQWKVVLASNSVHSDLRHLARSERWIAALPELLDDCSALLRDALDLMHTLGGVDAESDRGCSHRPSISDHKQNKDRYEWTVLIELARDAWLTTAQKSLERARAVAEIWAQEPYAVFRRLAFFAATQKERVISLQQAVKWLLADRGRWFWARATRRETIRLLVFLAPQLEEDSGLQAKLERAILRGPQRDHFSDIEPEQWTGIVERHMWLRLAKMEGAGARLSEEAKLRLDELSERYPSWKIEEDESDEFPVWTQEVIRLDRDRDPWKTFTPVPRTIRGIMDYLRAFPTLTASQQDDWSELCSDKFRASAYALCKFAQQNEWPGERWRVALQVWTVGDLCERSWQYMAPIVAGLPADSMQDLAYEVSRWLWGVPTSVAQHEDHFFTLVNRILALDFDSKGEPDKLVTKAINHPIGIVTEALLGWWFRQKPNDGQGLPPPIKPIFTQICDIQVEKFRHGRVLLSAHAVSLFRVDKKWFEQYLLPLFDWKNSEVEALAAWKGFLWSPRLYDPLMEVMKPAFLDAAKHYEQLGEHGRQFADLLTLAALESRDVFTTAELRDVMGKLSVKGLNASLRMLAKTLGGAGSQRKNYWENRFLPFWSKIWPKTKLDLDAEEVALLCIAAGEEFPSAVKTLKSWLEEISDPFHVLGQLEKSSLCKKCPSDALQLLSEVVRGELPSWAAQSLRKCLNDISQADSTLRDDRELKRLDTLARKFSA